MKLSKNLTKQSNEFCKKNKTKVIDIVLYGSSVKGKLSPRDIDILLICQGQTLKDIRDLTYTFSKLLKKQEIKADVKGMNLKDFFNPKFLMRQAVLIEGISLIDKKKLGEKLGFKGHVLFSFSTKKLSHSKKTRFQYAFKGRRQEPGILKEVKGEHLGAGVVMIPIECSLEFQMFLDTWDVDYKKKICLVG